MLPITATPPRHPSNGQSEVQQLTVLVETASKFVGTADRGERELAKLVGLCPKKGYVSALAVTEKQMGRMTTIWDGGKRKENGRPVQLVLF